MFSSDGAGWTGVSGTRDDDPFILRYVTDLEPLPSYATLLRIVWIYSDSETGAMPDETDSEAMAEFENLLVERLEVDELAVLTAALTFDGARQWVWYTRDVSECGERLNSLPPTEEPYPIELDAQDDPEWKYLFETIIGQISGGA